MGGTPIEAGERPPIFEAKGDGEHNLGIILCSVLSFQTDPLLQLYLFYEQSEM